MSLSNTPKIISEMDMDGRRDLYFICSHTGATNDKNNNAPQLVAKIKAIPLHKIIDRCKDMLAYWRLWTPKGYLSA